MNSSLGVYPPVIKIQANEGAQISVPVVIVNNSDHSASFDLTLKVFRSSSKNDGTIEYYPVSLLPKTEADFLNTVSVTDASQPIKSINLYPNESRKLFISFTSQEKPQDHYFSLIFFPHTEEGSGSETLIHTSSGVAINVLVSENQNKPIRAQIDEFTTNGFTTRGPVVFHLSLENTGTSFTESSGNISIHDLFGNKVGSIPLRPSTLLGGDTRNMYQASSGKSPSLPSWNEHFLMGYYTAKATVLLDKSTPLSAETHFFAVPVTVILIIAVILFFILGVVYRVIRKLNFKEK